jgi:hypothetical protein
MFRDAEKEKIVETITAILEKAVFNSADNTALIEACLTTQTVSKGLTTDNVVSYVKEIGLFDVDETNGTVTLNSKRAIARLRDTRVALTQMSQYLQAKNEELDALTRILRYINWSVQINLKIEAKEPPKKKTKKSKPEEAS